MYIQSEFYLLRTQLKVHQL